MKTQILLFILLSVCLNTFTQALVPDYDSQTEELYEFIEMRIHKQQTAIAVDEFVHELKQFISKINRIRNIVPESHDEKIKVMDLLNNVEIDALCTGCQNVVALMKKHVDTENFQTLFENVANSVCEKHLNKTVCVEAVSSYGSVVFTALMDKTFNATHICQRILFCPRTDHKEFLKDYVAEVLKDKPATNYPTPTKRSTYTVLHLTDPHIDLQYQEGSASVCTEPLCCRAESGGPINSSTAAQYWGTLADCDVPMRTFDQFLLFASTNFDIDMILWTGDNIAHDIWHQNASNQTVSTYDATQEILKYFPKTPIYPMFGNHEAFPADQFDFIGNGSDWLTSQLADMWQMWLDENATNELRNLSFYSTVNAEHNVKIIALDTIACDTMDFYLLEDPTDPHGQLAWLRAELYDSEAKNQSVFIMGHIPPGDFGCDSRWSARYRALVDRFTNIIRAQFFGHTHNDQLQLVQSYADNSTVGVVYIAPSFTTFSDLNPSFRIFEVDSDTNSIINYYQYRLDLDKWNQVPEGPIAWDLAYGIVEQYDMADASFVSFTNMVETIKEKSDMAQTYVYNFMAGGKPKAALSARDLQHYYCEAKNSVSEDAFTCMGLKAGLGDLLSLLEQIIPGGWSFIKC